MCTQNTQLSQYPYKVYHASSPQTLLWHCINFLCNTLTCSLFIVCTVHHAHAHQTGKSTFKVTIRPDNGTVHSILNLPAKDLTHYLRLDETLVGEYTMGNAYASKAQRTARTYIKDQMTMHTELGSCTLSHKSFIWPVEPATHLRVEMFWQCPLPITKLSVYQHIMLNDRYGYQHLAHIICGEQERKVVFDAEHSVETITVDEISVRQHMQTHLTSQASSPGRYPFFFNARFILAGCLVLGLIALMATRRKGKSAPP